MSKIGNSGTLASTKKSPYPFEIICFGLQFLTKRKPMVTEMSVVQKEFLMLQLKDLREKNEKLYV
jgi:hypothetical protein